MCKNLNLWRCTVEKFKFWQILLGDKNATSLCSKNISTLKLTALICILCTDARILSCYFAIVPVQNPKEVEFKSLNLKQIHDIQWKLLCISMFSLIDYPAFPSFHKFFQPIRTSLVYLLLFFRQRHLICSWICENLEFGIREIIMRTLKNSFWIPPVFWG